MHHNAGTGNGRYIDGRCKAIHYCIEPNCNNVAGFKRRCKKCGYKFRSSRITGANNPNWKGGKRKTDPYVIVYSSEHPKKWVYEHRLVMEKHLDRRLKKQEVVHHINRHKKDNRIENLQLFKTNGAHKKFEKGCKQRRLF